MNCQPGDLAVVVEAYNPNNIGLILRVLHSHPNQKALFIEPGDHIWTAQSHQPQTYDVEGALVKKHHLEALFFFFFSTTHNERISVSLISSANG